jgi:hypothetical protein
MRQRPSAIPEQRHLKPMQADPLPASRRRCRELPLLGAYLNGVVGPAFHSIPSYPLYRCGFVPQRISAN